MSVYSSIRLALISALAVSTAYAGADLTVRHLGTSSLNKDIASFSFAVEVKNTGDAPYTGYVRVKPFIIPEVNVAGVNGMKAIQLDSNTTFINIAAGASQVVNYYADSLPGIAAAKYWLGTTVIPDVRLGDSNISNNVTNQLLPLGTFSNNGANPLDTTVDIYSDIRSQITPINGRANHPWRLSWRGTREGLRFNVIYFLYDQKLKYVYPSTYEKSVGWVNMGSDYDERGRLVPYDVYNQGPDFNIAAPGDLFLMTLSNYNESTFEVSHSNNLDARKFHASYISSKPSIEIWKTYVEENPNPFNENVALNSVYGGAGKHWYLDRGNLPESLGTNFTSGTTAPSYGVLFTYNDWAVDYGVYEYTGSIKVKNSAAATNVIESKDVNFVISKWVGGQQPVINVATAVAVSATSPFAPAPVTYAIQNTGLSPLKFKLEKNNDWIFFSQGAGTVAPGATVNITLSFSPIGRDLGNSAGSFTIYSNGVDSNKLISVTYTDNAPAPTK